MEIKKGDILYYARIIPTVGIYEVLEIKVRTVGNDYFAGVDKFSKQAFIFNYKDIDNIIFKDRKDALNKVKLKERG